MYISSTEMGKLEMSKIATPLGDSKEVQIRLNGRPYPPFTIKKITNLHKVETVATPDLQLQTVLNIDYIATGSKTEHAYFD